MKLKIDSVGKQYGANQWGLRDFSLQLGPGILGLLGRNGAGKSTLMRVLSTFTQPTEGRVFWNGADIAESPETVRAIVGYLPQHFGYYPNLSAVEFLEYMAALRGLDARAADRRIDELIALVNLEDACDRPMSGYSGGMAQRVGIAQALLNDPELVIVDEPTVGLDPEERVRFRHLIAQLSGDRVVILSTHIVSDIEATANEVAIVDQGRLLAHQPLETLLTTVEDRVWEWTVGQGELAAVRDAYLVSATTRRADGIRVRVVSDTAPDPGAQPLPPNLEDAYLDIVSPQAE